MGFTLSQLGLARRGLCVRVLYNYQPKFWGLGFRVGGGLIRVCIQLALGFCGLGSLDEFGYWAAFLVGAWNSGSRVLRVALESSWLAGSVF